MPAVKTQRKRPESRLVDPSDIGDSSVKRFVKIAAALAVASAFTSQAQAAGFMLTEQSAGALGRAYAGVGVDGLDISGMFYNPATMSLHSGTMMQAGFVQIGVNAEYQGVISGAHENGRLKSQTIPHGYLMHQINDSVWAGLAMTVPWGMGTEYADGWEGRGRGTASKLRSFDFNPNMAWKVSDSLTVGAGVSIQYVAANLKVGAQDATLGQFTTEYKADSMDWGFNVGAMWKPVDSLRFGVSYRSEIAHHTEGWFATYSARGETKMDATLDVSGPAWAMATVAWDATDALSLYGTFRWTQWSSFGDLHIKSSSGPLIKTIPNKWKDTYLGTVGFDYRIDGRWTVRSGVGYETSAIDDYRNRTAVLPDADRWWFAAGLGCRYSKDLQFDIGASWLKGVHERSLYTATGAEFGRYDKLDAYIFGVQMVYSF